MSLPYIVKYALLRRILVPYFWIRVCTLSTRQTNGENPRIDTLSDQQFILDAPTKSRH